MDYFHPAQALAHLLTNRPTGPLPEWDEPWASLCTAAQGALAAGDDPRQAIDPILDTLTPQENNAILSQVLAFFTLGALANLTRRQREVYVALCRMGLSSVTAVAAAVGADPGNTHRRLKALAQRKLVATVKLKDRTLYFTTPKGK